ncbi:hypothetical protein [Roseomonas marmotae]|uniref:Uncharacterized protein n=1 Tax=Roseomonas marmotae TaxID=2768161 RepID=A0ABS3KGH8_9PROT|nr:hypothetical protein [Roseomonas marmotae]MBO1076527.1 hypothetical protein [Roseomonas marmotae]QTI81856.1 hypothetical protein IAI58_21150 [Roseomonas marmotae]
MRMARFYDLLDTYGADLGRWPRADAEAARTLLKASPEAQERLRHTSGLDDALRGSRMGPDPAALARMRAHVAVHVARMPLPAVSSNPWAMPLDWLRGLVPVGCGALAVLLASGLWLTYAPPLADAPEFSAPRQIAMIESTE